MFRPRSNNSGQTLRQILQFDQTCCKSDRLSGSVSKNSSLSILAVVDERRSLLNQYPQAV
jgi:hypothetical protein